MIPDLQFSRVLEAATYDPIGPSTNNVAGAVSVFINFHVIVQTNMQQVLLTLGIHNPQEHKGGQELVHHPQQSTPLLQHVPQSIWK